MLLDDLALPIPNDIPMFWINTPNMGTTLIPIPGSRNASFLPIKSPLNSQLQKVFHKKRRWYPEIIINECNDLIKEIPITYVVLDLDINNNVEDDWEKKVEYKNIPIHTYTQREALNFAQEVNKYIEKYSDANKLVFLVTCIDGSNKSGFAICSYLTLESGIDYSKAVSDFAKSKEPGIYDRKVLEALAICQKTEIKTLPRIVKPKWIQENKYIGKTSHITVSPEFSPGFTKYNAMQMKDPRLIERIQARVDEFKHPNIKNSNSTMMETVEIWNKGMMEEFSKGLYRVTFHPRGTRVIIVVDDRKSFYALYGRGMVWKFPARIADRCPLPLVCTAVSIFSQRTLKIYLTDILRAGTVDFQSNQLDMRLSTLFYDVLRDVRPMETSLRLLFRPVGRIFDAAKLVEEVKDLELKEHFAVEGFSLIPYTGGPGRSIFLPSNKATVLLLFRCISESDACLYARSDTGNSLVPFTTLDFRDDMKTGSFHDFVIRFRVSRSGELTPMNNLRYEVPDTISYAKGIIHAFTKGDTPLNVANEWVRIANEKSKAPK